MAQDITLLGASYEDVPAVTLPKTGGGTAMFTDVTDTTAAAADVAAGKWFYDALGDYTEGTASGGYVTQDADGYIVLPSAGGGGGGDYTVANVMLTVTNVSSYPGLLMSAELAFDTVYEGHPYVCSAGDLDPSGELVPVVLYQGVGHIYPGLATPGHYYIGTAACTGDVTSDPDDPFYLTVTGNGSVALTITGED